MYPLFNPVESFVFERSRKETIDLAKNEILNFEKKTGEKISESEIVLRDLIKNNCDNFLNFIEEKSEKIFKLDKNIMYHYEFSATTDDFDKYGKKKNC